MKKFSRIIFFVLSLILVYSNPISANKNSINDLSNEGINNKISEALIPFIENKGQIKNENIKYYAKTINGDVYISNEDIKYFFTVKSDNSLKTFSLREEPVKNTSFPHSTSLNRRFNAQGTVKSNVVINYFTGRESGKFTNNIPVFNEVSLGEVWPGIELKVKAHGNTVEKLFILSPHSEVGQIQLDISGCEAGKINETGELSILGKNGEIKFSTPVAYQEIDGKKADVDVKFVINDDSVSQYSKLSYGFEVGAYNSDYPLVIDPLLAATFIGGSYDNEAAAILIDSGQNVVIAGSTYSYDFPTTTGANDEDYNYGWDVFISKFDNKLGKLISSTFFGGINDDLTAKIFKDTSGNIFVTGITNSNDLPITSTQYNKTYNGGIDIFIAKFDSTLSTLLGMTYIGGGGDDNVRGMSGDEAGDIFITGVTTSNNFPVNGAYQNTYKGNSDIFISKISDKLDTLIASTFFGGLNYDEANGIAIDLSGNVFITGSTLSADLKTTSGSYNPSFGAGREVFISKFNNALGVLLKSTFFGGSKDDYANSIKNDSLGLIYIVGKTNSKNLPTTSASYKQKYTWDYDAFASKFDNELSTLLASTYLGGTYFDSADALVINNSLGGAVYVTGVTQSVDFDTKPGSFDTSFNGEIDAFISKFDLSLQLQASTFIGTDVNNESQGVFGSTSYDYAKAITIDQQSKVFVAGYTFSSDFPVTIASYSQSHNSIVTLPGAKDDAFVVSFDKDLNNEKKIPTVTTNQATNIGTSKATLRGTVNSRDLPTYYWFEYGLTSGTYEAETVKTKIDGNSDTPVSSTITGLNGATLYYSRVVAENSSGRNNGNEVNFYTPDPIAPSGTIIINSGANYATSPQLTLSLTAEDNLAVAAYLISTSSIPVESRPGNPGWVSITPEQKWSLEKPYSFSGSDGVITIYVYFKDVTGTVSGEASDDIKLDRLNPSLSITDPANDPHTTTNQTITISGTAADANGIKKVSWINNTNSQKGDATETTSLWIILINLESKSNSVTISAEDNAGNKTEKTITIIQSPVTESITPVTKDSSNTNSTSATLNGSFTVTPSSTDQYLCWFKIGTTSGSYSIESDGTNASSGDVSETITGLTPNTIYYFKIFVKSESGTDIESAIEKSFKTLTTDECIPASITISPRASRIKIKRKSPSNIEVKVTGDNDCLSSNVEILAEIIYGDSRISMITEEALTDNNGVANFTIYAKKRKGNATIRFILPDYDMAKNQRFNVVNKISKKKRKH